MTIKKTLMAILLAGSLFWNTGCVSKNILIKPEVKKSIAGTSISKPSPFFKELNTSELEESRTYEEILQKAKTLGYKTLKINKVGNSPAVILIGWEHSGLKEHIITPTMKRGLELILDSYEKNDFMLPEGYGFGKSAKEPIYNHWDDMTIFLYENKPERYKKKIFSSPVTFVESDKPNIDFNKYEHLNELYDMYTLVQEQIEKKDDEKGMFLFSKYLDKSKEFFPDWTEEERLNFYNVYNKNIDYLKNEERNERDIGYLFPSIENLTKIKNPSQIIYATRGYCHILNKELTKRLKNKGIGFIALIPEEVNTLDPECK